jgi:hypothetical protein
VRRAHLLGTSPGGLNGAFLLTNSTVQGDPDNDKLTGGTETDWFWANVNEIVDLSAALGEKVGTN